MRRLLAFGLVVLFASCSGTPSGNDGGGGSGGSGGGSGGSGGSGGAGGGSGGTGGGGTGGGSAACLAGAFLQSLGKSKLLLGATMEDATAIAAPFTLRYRYISGGVFDGNTPCVSCASGCTTAGTTCANSGPGCSWWGCWQYDQDPPGDFVRGFIGRTRTDGQLPMFTYYQWLQTAKVSEGPTQVLKGSDAAFLTRYFADYRFFLQQLGTNVALVHLEPDLWGYAERQNADPHAIAAAVTSANAVDCGSEENSFAGVARCLVAMTRKYAPNARVGFHASAWSTGIDVSGNTTTSLSIAGEANKTGDYLLALGAAGTDFLVVEASDRDAGYYQSIGQNRWWDATNATLPNFTQMFAWVKALAERVNKALVWWQLPVGNMALPGGNLKWKDNRVDYFYAHPDEVARAHGAGFAFGAGMGGMVTPESDNGNLTAKTSALAASGGQSPCP